ncbi:MAG: hypothetical protein V9G29_18385 [Burkholderiaceae bacterium]
MREASGGLDVKQIAGGIVHALNPSADRSPHEADAALRQAVKPLADPALRALLLGLKAQQGTGHRHRHARPRARSRIQRGRARRVRRESFRASRPSSPSTRTRSPRCRSSTAARSRRR